MGTVKIRFWTYISSRILDMPCQLMKNSTQLDWFFPVFVLFFSFVFLLTQHAAYSNTEVIFFLKHKWSLMQNPTFNQSYLINGGRQEFGLSPKPTMTRD